MKQHWMMALTVAALGATSAVVAISASEMDDFEDGTLEGWQQGAVNSLSNVPDGGPMGAGDNYLVIPSTGGSGPGSRSVAQNFAQWAGDYNAVGGEFVISMDVRNEGATGVDLRVGVSNRPLAVRGPLEPEAHWVTTTSVLLPAPGPRGGTWENVQFTLSSSEMTRVFGTATLEEVLDDVVTFRIINSEVPAWEGDVVAAQIGVDNINVLQTPVALQSFSVE